MYHLCDFYEGNDITDINKAKSFFKGFYPRLFGGNFYKDKDVKFDKFQQILIANNCDWSPYIVINPYHSPQENYDKIMGIYPKDSGNLRQMWDVEIVPPPAKLNNGSQVADETYKTIEMLNKGVGCEGLVYTGNWYWNPNMWYKQGATNKFLFPPWQDKYDYCLAQYYWKQSVNGNFTSYNNLKTYIPTNWCKPLDGSAKIPFSWQWSGDQFVVPGFGGKLDFIMITEENYSKLYKNPNQPEQPKPNPPIEIITNPDDDGNTAVNNPNDKKLNVVYKSQLTTGALKFKNDCGAAVVGMMVDTYNNVSTYIDDIYLKIRPSGWDSFLSVYEIRNVLGKYNIPSNIRWTHNLQDIRNNIDAGKPSIVVIKYSYLQQAGYADKNVSFTGIHYVLAVGYNNDEIIIHDPLYYDNKGAFIHIPNIVFQKALNDPSCGMIIVPSKSLIPSEIKPYNQYKVTVTERYIRSNQDATTRNSIVETKHNGDIVNVDYIENGWGHIYQTNYWIYMNGMVKI